MLPKPVFIWDKLESQSLLELRNIKKPFFLKQLSLAVISEWTFETQRLYYTSVFLLAAIFPGGNWLFLLPGGGERSEAAGGGGRGTVNISVVVYVTHLRAAFMVRSFYVFMMDAMKIHS